MSAAGSTPAQCTIRSHLMCQEIDVALYIALRVQLLQLLGQLLRRSDLIAPAVVDYGHIYTNTR